MLLTEAISKMRSNNCRYGVLHCSKELIPLYRSVGFVSAPAKFESRVFVAHYPNAESSKRVHRLDIEDKRLLVQLIDLHQSSNQRFNGCIVRQDPDYWACKSSGCLWVCISPRIIAIVVNHESFDPEDANYNLPSGGFWLEKDVKAVGTSHNESASVSAFAALRATKDVGKFVLADFFADSEELSVDGGFAVLRLVRRSTTLVILLDLGAL